MVLDTILLQFSVHILGVPLPLWADTPQVSDMAGPAQFVPKPTHTGPSGNSTLTCLVSSSTEVVSLVPPIGNSNHNMLTLRQQPASREQSYSKDLYGGMPKSETGPLIANSILHSEQWDDLLELNVNQMRARWEG